jgi:hypothetical protein
MIGLMRRVLNGRENVFPLQVGIVGEDLLLRSAGAQKFENVDYSTWFPADISARVNADTSSR